LARAGIVDSISRRSIFTQTEEVIGSLFEAYAAAEEWIAQQPVTREAEPVGTAE
jgi:hypothetical protein